MMQQRPTIEIWPVERLAPYAGNARLHSDEQVSQIARSMKAFGFNAPILVDGGGTLIAGHGRLLAARQLGLAEVPVVSLPHLSDEQVRAYRIADNQLALNASWDKGLLALELGELDSAGIDLSLLGFGIDALAQLRGATEGLTDPDEAPALAERAVPVTGDLWILGSHRLLCGDATSRSDVSRVLGSDRPHLMVTDPPYGVAYDPAWRNSAGLSNTRKTGKVLNDDRADWREAWALFPGDVAYVWHGALHSVTVAESLKASGFNIRAQIIWAKERLVLSRGDYHWQHEPCWYAVRDKATGHWSGDRSQTTLWTISSRSEDMETVHGTQKPVECMKRPIENNSHAGDVIYEPFSGSGTTLIAAEQLGRPCRAIELDPLYVDVAIRRWQAFTGRSATHSETGETFDSIATKRLEGKEPSHG